jgi:preprotein translocase subunit SecG
MITLLTVVHVAVCLFLIVIVLLQHGKGADAGATFGGSGQSLFGTEGPVPLLNKITTSVAIVFMLTSVALAYYSSSKSTGSVMTEVAQPQPTVKEASSEAVKKDEQVVPVPVSPATPVGASEGPAPAEAPKTPEPEGVNGKTKE